MNASLNEHLTALKLHFTKEHYPATARDAAASGVSHIEFLATLMAGEAAAKHDRSVARRIKLARLPVLKTLAQFDWSWPKEINKLQIQNLMELQFITQRANVIFLGNVGLGKTHLSIALAYTACLHGHSVLFTTAIEAVNSLTVALHANRLKPELARYVKPSLLVLDELGYLPIDKTGADLLFQILSSRYERGATVITSNRPYKQWPEIFNNDATLTSAILDRLLHHVETVQIAGRSYRTKESR